jgi:hypothetical protein
MPRQREGGPDGNAQGVCSLARTAGLWRVHQDKATCTRLLRIMENLGDVSVVVMVLFSYSAAIPRGHLKDD